MKKLANLHDIEQKLYDHFKTTLSNKKEIIKEIKKTCLFSYEEKNILIRRIIK